MDQIESLQEELVTLRKTLPQAATASAPEVIASTETKAEPEGIPFMITNKMRKQLVDLGYSLEDIQAMTPTDAHAVLQAAADGQGKEPENDAAPHVGE